MPSISLALNRRTPARAGAGAPSASGRRCGRDVNFRGDLAYGKPALVELREPVVIKNQASPAADAPLAARFLESASYSLADVLVFLLGDPSGDWTISRPAHLLNRNAPRKS